MKSSAAESFRVNNRAKAAMKKPITAVEIEFVPWICLDCGNIQLMADLARGNKMGNCQSCESWNVEKAGPEQTASVSIFRHLAAAFKWGEA